MKMLYFDCSMGVAGDMLCAALFQLHPAPETVLAKIRGMQLPGVTVELHTVTSHGIVGAQYRVEIDGMDELVEDYHHHHGRHLGDIEAIIRGCGLDSAVCDDAIAVYRLLAAAESKVHGCDMEHIHFHEVGTLDAIIDITTACLLLHELSPDKIIASAIHVGSGTIHCAHGILPVPAPATAELLKGIPCYSSEVRGELCTPTGAALMKHFAEEFAPMPEMRMDSIGYGIGKRNYDRANCVRALLGNATEKSCT